MLPIESLLKASLTQPLWTLPPRSRTPLLRRLRVLGSGWEGSVGGSSFIEKRIMGILYCS